MTPWAPRPIPQHQPAQLHLSHGLDQWLGDSERAPKEAGRSGCTDTNLQPLLDGAGAIHAETPRKAGFHFIAISRGRRRPLTEEELDRPFTGWHRKDFVRLRRTRRRGIRFVTRVRPLLYAESVAAHKRYGAIPVFELKGQFTREQATKMVDLAHRQRQTVWFKTLVFQAVHPPRPGYSMQVAGRKLAPFQSAGAQCALATHGYTPPADLEKWRHTFDVVWGTNAEEYR